MPVTIKVRLNGPYLVDLSQGDVVLIDHEGTPIPVPEGKPNIALCRCGASTTKPFCDRSHSRIGFVAAEAAQRAADERRLGGAPG
jgi:CDGSH-type Zn-finger protein